jgi:hypothetical protein
MFWCHLSSDIYTYSIGIKSLRDLILFIQQTTDVTVAIGIKCFQHFYINYLETI